MTQTIDLFERAVHVTNRWLAEAARELGDDDRAAGELDDVLADLLGPVRGLLAST